jgi:hypothetical protein
VGGAARAALTGPVQQRRADLVQDGEGLAAVLAVIGTVVCADSFSRSRRDLAGPRRPRRAPLAVLDPPAGQ